MIDRNAEAIREVAALRQQLEKVTKERDSAMRVYESAVAGRMAFRKAFSELKRELEAVKEKGDKMRKDFAASQHLAESRCLKDDD